MTTNKLPKLPSLTKVNRKCACGCDRLTQSTFYPGHDSRLKALLIRVTRGVMSLDEVAKWGGEATRKAVETYLKDRDTLIRWRVIEETDTAKSA